MKRIPNKINIQKISEIIFLSFFYISITYIYFFPSIFIMLIIAINTLMYLFLINIYHRYANRYTLSNNKRMKNLIKVFEKRYNKKYVLVEKIEILQTTILNENKYRSPIYEKKLFKKALEMEITLLRAANAICSYGMRLVEIEILFTQRLLRDFLNK